MEAGVGIPIPVAHVVGARVAVVAGRSPVTLAVLEATDDRAGIVVLHATRLMQTRVQAHVARIIRARIAVVAVPRFIEALAGLIAPTLRAGVRRLIAQPLVHTARLGVAAVRRARVVVVAVAFLFVAASIQAPPLHAGIGRRRADGLVHTPLPGHALVGTVPGHQELHM